MTDEEIAGQKRLAVERALAVLRENFDVALVLVSHEMTQDRTGRIFKGYGNIYAQIGMAKQFMEGETEC